MKHTQNLGQLLNAQYLKGALAVFGHVRWYTVIQTRKSLQNNTGLLRSTQHCHGTWYARPRGYD